MYFFELENWFICLTGLVMIPQVIHNIRNGNNPKFIYAYIFGILCPSMFYPVNYNLMIRYMQEDVHLTLEVWSHQILLSWFTLAYIYFKFYFSTFNIN